VAYCALVAVAVPLAVLFPVDAPGLYLLDVRPLLLAFDPAVDGPTTAAALVGATPSLTTGLSVLAALYARNATDAFARAVAALAGAVVLSALYLGVHWLTDAAAAAALAVCVYWLTQRVDPDRLDPVARVGSR
jgi:membrane-associated phospholipid phosphatase